MHFIACCWVFLFHFDPLSHPPFAFLLPLSSPSHSTSRPIGHAISYAKTPNWSFLRKFLAPFSRILLFLFFLYYNDVSILKSHHESGRSLSNGVAKNLECSVNRFKEFWEITCCQYKPLIRQKNKSLLLDEGLVDSNFRTDGWWANGSIEREEGRRSVS